MTLWPVLLAVAIGAQAQEGGTAELRTQGEQLARSGADREALQRFQAAAAANPDDLEARLWIARLHERMGHSSRALPVYESIVASHPQHLEALTGLGSALTAEGRLHEAADTLNRAESLGAENAAVLAAQARLHARAGRSRLALAYYERALALQPGASAVLDGYTALRAARAHRLELGYAFEHFDTDISDPQAGSAAFDLRASDVLRVQATVQHQRKFNRSETRGGGGVDWTVRPDVRLHGGALFSEDAEILPGTDVFGGVGYTTGRATWTVDLRFAAFQDLDARLAGAGWRFTLPSRSAVWIKYYRFDTDYEAARSDIVHSWVLGGSGLVNRIWTLGAEYTRGPDQLHLLTLDRTGRFDANTISTFAEVRVAPMFSVGARYDYQARPADVSVHRVQFLLVPKF